MNILKVTKLSKRFGGLMAISELSFELGQGGILGLIGPNGAGKTTVFNCLSGFHAPDAGEMIFSGKSLVGMQPYQVCQAGLARTFQIVRPFLTISVLDNVMVGALIREKSIEKARSGVHGDYRVGRSRSHGPQGGRRVASSPSEKGWRWPGPWQPARNFFF